MNVREALYARRSIRQFSDRDIAPEVLEGVIESALQSPSGSNAQPYRIAVATGQTCQAIRQELSAKYEKASKVKGLPLPLKVWHGLTGKVLPDGDYNPDVKYPAELHQRKFDCGMGLYESLGIERHDKEGRNRQMQRNFEFFDAPAAIFIFVNDTLGRYSALDAGIFMQSLMLAAVEEGLGTCSQAALAIWGSPIRKRFQIEGDYKLLCGISIGYPAEHRVNHYQPEKRSIDNVCLAERRPVPRPA